MFTIGTLTDFAVENNLSIFNTTGVGIISSGPPVDPEDVPQVDFKYNFLEHSVSLHAALLVLSSEVSPMKIPFLKRAFVSSQA